eukprot:TRINITY_DN4692_c0_g1_i1.p1 TRINITY_DN4692_c0_g1~~TRINITY_DN4692_c0_g1_i1.p1  ORF type:complete len:468 (-),score=75.04 TRINITY_DN4692_c0_g1_i1:328-1731(-)
MAGGRNEADTVSPLLPELAAVLPRVLIVSRRTLRKNKFVDFVGEYHLDLIVSYGAVPVIVPRVSGLQSLLDSFEPIHGVLLCEGEDIDPELYESDLASLTQSEIEEIRRLHSSDTSLDKDKDSIELQLARRCLERNIPYLGICRGSQVLNVACGGSLYQDVEKQVSTKVGVAVKHMDYDNYDGHRHPIRVLEDTPLHEWFKGSLSKSANPMELIVNSYHHQGVKRLAASFKPMAFAPDGLTEAFYDPDVHNPEEGGFIVGLQFHPERMRHEQDAHRTPHSDISGESVFDYPECPRAYQEFVKAVVAFQKRLLSRKEKGGRRVDSVLEQRGDMVEKQRQKIVRSFSIAKHIYDEQVHVRKSSSLHNGGFELEALEAETKQSSKELEFGAQFLEGNTPLNTHQVKRLQQMGATVRNSSLVLENLKSYKQKQSAARKKMEEMDKKELLDLMEFHKMMYDVAASLVDKTLA